MHPLLGPIVPAFVDVVSLVVMRTWRGLADGRGTRPRATAPYGTAVAPASAVVVGIPALYWIQNKAHN